MTCPAPGAIAKRPNILLVTSDQQHFSTLGCTNPLIQTPALDRLCRAGTRFDRAYCPNPTCSPTRASIITGLYPSAHGCWTLGTKLAEDVPTIGEMLRRAGYDATLIGKAHFQPLASTPEQTSIECQPVLRDLAFWRHFHGPWYGFNHVETARMHADESHAGGHYGIWMEEHGLKNWRDYFWPWPHTPDMLKRRHHWDLPAEFHYSVWTAERTIARLEHCAQRQEPFFLWSSFHDPHPPYLAPAPWDRVYDPVQMPIGRYTEGEFDHMPPQFALTRQEHPDVSPWEETRHFNHGVHSHLHDPEELKKDMAVYYGMTSLMDQQIGRILDRLDALGIADNTLVVFSSDHGHFLGQHGLIAKGPFHYEDLVKVPYIVRWPGQVPAGAVSQGLQSLVDLAPSFLSAAGIPVPGAVQGVDQTPVWRGAQEQARDHIVVENRHQPTKLHLRTYINGRYKLTAYRQETYGELFDLQSDPGELHNHWDDPAYAEVKRDLLLHFVQADMRREPMRYERISHA